MNFSIKPISLIMIVFGSLLTSCSSESSDPEPAADKTVDLKEALLDDFSFSEAAYISIDITQPEIKDNLETKPGEIKIKVPNGSALELSLKKTNLDPAAFSITPAAGTKKTFSTTEPVVYTIVSLKNPKQVIHYKVLIELEVPHTSETPEITAFKFEKSKNNALAQDIAAAKIDNEKKQLFIFVPVGTDFSSLTPTITFKGEKLYILNGNAKEEYPAAGKKTDFKYPKTFSIQIESDAGAKSQFYSVIVDVKNPIKFEVATVEVPNVKKNEDFFEKIGTFTNQGNHPITAFANTYKNKIPDLDTSNIGLISLTIPGGGLLPGESSDVKFSLNKTLAKAVPAGTYQFTAVVPPGFFEILNWPPDAAQLLQPSELAVQVNLIE
ncbi:hypothetical protein [Flavobacterium aestuarii]|uniref:hypothetical protein n=1 Tax=Flavobacterium aestuarii TaxID=3149227 RepID=UPI0032B4A45F